MNATEMMIGDIVSVSGKPIHVTLATIRAGIEVKPIELTSEIFEKSGFTLNEEENPILTIRVYSLDADDVAVIQRPKGGWKFMHGNATSNQQDLFFGDGKFVCMPIQYVHELQHALKLCGIEKKVVL